MMPEDNSNMVNMLRWQKSMMDNYGTPGLTLVRGRGCDVTDADGRKYLDLTAGIAVNALGYAHPAVTTAVTDQAAQLGHVSNLYAHEPGLRLAEELRTLVGEPEESRVLFCNSGAEANETAFKIARLSGRTKIVSAEGGFHGRTMGALALTGQPDRQAPFEPLPGGVTHVAYGDTEALESEVDNATAAVVLEPIQGEAGVLVPPEGYLAAAREIATRHGALLILDEVQTGVGRTGDWFAFQRSGILPDVVTLAKGLGGGLPLGACIGIGAAALALRPGHHASTFGGNPISCAAALAVLDTIASEDLLTHVARMSKELMAGLREMAHPLVTEVRGSGLLLGLVLAEPVAADVVAAGREAGFLLNAVRPDVLRLSPPLVLQSHQIRRFLGELPGILDMSGGSR